MWRSYVSDKSIPIPDFWQKILNQSSNVNFSGSNEDRIQLCRGNCHGCDIIYTSKKRRQQDRHLFLSLDRNLFTISKLLWLHTSSATFQLVLPNKFQVSFRVYLYRVSKVALIFFSQLNKIKMNKIKLYKMAFKTCIN